MTTETLRGAASLMRARAEKASPSPWVKTVWPKAIPGVYSQAIEDTHEFDPEVARTLDEPDAEHIASWSPAVALAVADWLDAEFEHPFGPTAEAIDVASAYLGGAA